MTLFGNRTAGNAITFTQESSIRNDLARETFVLTRFVFDICVYTYVCANGTFRKSFRRQEVCESLVIRIFIYIYVASLFS